MAIDQTRTSPAGHEDLGTFDLDGLRISAPKRELAAINPNSETTTREVLLHALPPGGVFVDVGAHVGSISLPAARHVGSTGHVHAVEPSPATSRTLTRNVRENGLEGNITIHHCAVGTERSRGSFHVMDFSYLNGLAAHPLGHELETVEVDVFPLDALVNGRVDVVKIDVEGAELAALRGMTRIARENPHMMLCVEWNPVTLRRSGTDPTALIDVIGELGLNPTLVIDEANGGRELRVEDVWASLAFDSDAVWWGNVIAYGPTAP
jgi:FkbM family methyltransferase